MIEFVFPSEQSDCFPSDGLLFHNQIRKELSATYPKSLFLKALTEGLRMIRPGAVDICRPMMVRYSIIYGVTG